MNKTYCMDKKVSKYGNSTIVNVPELNAGDDVLVMTKETFKLLTNI